MLEIDRIKIKGAFTEGKSRLFFLDYDGTLAPITRDPAPVPPSGKIKDLLLKLSLHPRTQVVIISGRSKEDLDRTIGDLPVLLAAEHGGFFRKPEGKWIERFPASVSWKSRLRPAIRKLNDRYGGSISEEKNYSICWHYRPVQDMLQEGEIGEVLSTLRLIPNENEFVIEHDHLTIEIRSVGIDKGKFAAQWIFGQRDFDFILAMGDGKTDEDLFESIGPGHFTIKIGEGLQSSARYRLSGQDRVESFLSDLI